jgi:predicted nucleotidyltransferase component of viral defense system
MLQTKTVEPFTLELLKRLSGEKILEKFVLVGGTALALQIGHRKSIDLDFFCPFPFDASALLSDLKEITEISTLAIDNNTLISNINGVKVDFIRFRYPFQKPFLIEEGIRMLSVDDIAPMKLDAITGRGQKKDFYDLHFLFNYYTLDSLLKMYKTMFGHETVFHVLKSLTYFVDADENPDPDILDKKITWPKVKKKIVEQVETLSNGKAY